jgi:hypothetical protein
MNLLIKIIIITFISFGFNPAFSQNCKAKLSIEVDVEEAKLFVNDEYIGIGNKFVTELDTGKFIIYITDNLWKWNSKSVRDTIYIIACDEINLEYHLDKKILFETTPSDVYVFKDDSLIGFTPLLMEDIQGNYLLKKPDYQNIKVEMQEIKDGEKPRLEFIGEVKGESFYESTMFKVLVGAALALGATTAYFKLEADKSFDEYQVTGDLDLLDKTDRYDVISGISFVALQIDFGLILYYFLTD